ncbi:MAG: thiamine pyrophosphate-dependent enzyme, partial [Pseudomonadota bacterium]
KYNMDITHVLLNNSQLGKITKEQRAGEFTVWQTDLVNPSFSGFARLCGGFGKKVSKPDDLDEVLAEALAHPGPALVEIVTDMELI